MKQGPIFFYLSAIIDRKQNEGKTNIYSEAVLWVYLALLYRKSLGRLEIKNRPLGEIKICFLFINITPSRQVLSKCETAIIMQVSRSRRSTLISLSVWPLKMSAFRLFSTCRPTPTIRALSIFSQSGPATVPDAMRSS